MLFTFPSRYWFAIGLEGVFSLGGWSRRFHAGFLVPCATQGTRLLHAFRSYGAFTLFGRPFQAFPILACSIMRALQPRRRLNARGLGSSPFARHYLGNHNCFLLLWVLRCFSSPRLPSLRNDRPSTCRVAPFGNHGINCYLHIPRAYRSLSRPSSPPRAKASTVCPCLLSLSVHIYCHKACVGLIYL